MENKFIKTENNKRLLNLNISSIPIDKNLVSKYYNSKCEKCKDDCFYCDIYIQQLDRAK